jgi:CRP-like cAMP-binding protein
MSPKATYPLVDIENVLPILGRISLFGGLTDKQLAAVFRLLERATYDAGEYIFRQGDQPSRIWIIQSGKVKIVAEEAGTPLEMLELGIGHCFGEVAVIGIQPHSASAIAVEHTELIVLSRVALFSFAEADPELFSVLVLNIAREACRRLHATDETLLHYFCRKNGPTR